MFCHHRGLLQGYSLFLTVFVSFTIMYNSNHQSQAVFLRVFFFSFSQHGKRICWSILQDLPEGSMICTKVDQQKHQLFNFIYLGHQLVVCNWVLDCRQSMWPIIGPNCSHEPEKWVEMCRTVGNFRQLILPLRSVCACLQHYISFSLQMSLSPLDVYIHHEKPVIKIKEIRAL